jgi:hypothetical protein
MPTPKKAAKKAAPKSPPRAVPPPHGQAEAGLLRKNGLPTKATMKAFVAGSAPPPEPEFAGHVPLVAPGTRPQPGDPTACVVEITKATSTNRRVVIDVDHLLGELEQTATDLRDLVIDLRARFKRTQHVSRYASSRVKGICRGINMIHERFTLIVNESGTSSPDNRDDVNLTEVAGTTNPPLPQEAPKT